MEYRLPAAVRDRLAAALKPLRNRDATMALACFVARYWTAPRRLGLPFALDRRALAPVAALNLTEAKIRGAVAALVRAGFLVRLPSAGRTHQRTVNGLHRRPVSYTIASDYRAAFDMANKRAQEARDRRSRERRGSALAVALRLPLSLPAARPANSPKYKSSEAVTCIWASSDSTTPAPAEPNSKLEAALARWGMALRERAG